MVVGVKGLYLFVRCKRKNFIDIEPYRRATPFIEEDDFGELSFLEEKFLLT